MSVDHIKISQQAKDQLVKLKRITGIEHWNVLCRWALCASFAEESAPPSAKISVDSNIDISWKVFGGRYADLYMALLKERCVRDGLGTDADTLAQQFRLHLHRGISYLAGNKNIRSIVDFIEMSTASVGQAPLLEPSGEQGSEVANGFHQGTMDGIDGTV